MLVEPPGASARLFNYDGFVISTLPAEHSRWLHMDLPREGERQYGLPVIYMGAHPDRLRY